MPKEQPPSKPTSRGYSAEQMAGAVRMARDAARGVGHHGVIQRVADRLGYGVESVRGWVRRADIDDGYPAGVSTTGAQRISGTRTGESRT